MSEFEYNDLIRNAAALRPQVVRTLRNSHRDADFAEIEDDVDAALIAFQDRKKILTILRPEKPFTWLVSTAENIYRHNLRKNSRNISIDDLTTEPTDTDRKIESFEASEAIEMILSKIHERYSKILKEIEWDGFSFEEIAARENKSIKAIYDRYERAKKKAFEIAVKLGLTPPPARIVPFVIKIILRKNRNQVRYFSGLKALILTQPRLFL